MPRFIIMIFVAAWAASASAQEGPARVIDGDTLDISGQRYGKLVAIHPTSKHGGKRGMPWLCECDCGREVVLELGRLRSPGGRKHCGQCSPLPSNRNPTKKMTIVVGVVINAYDDGDAHFVTSVTTPLAHDWPVYMTRIH